MKQELRAAIRSILATPHLMLLGGALAATVNVSADAAELPVVCAAGNCGVGGPSQWVTSGTASAVQTQNTLTINQSSERAVLNWSSFNVSADGRVVFNQPNANSIALNRIYQDSASRIFGAVEANGQIYLVNQNGFVFGRTARINAAGILASTLSISDQTFASGLVAPELVNTARPALGGDPDRPDRQYVIGHDDKLVTDANGNPIEVKLVVEEGAELQSRGAGGRVLLASQEIDNAGKISSPDGQVILAAGEKVYLQASTDPGLRGLLVEVDAGGEAWNRMTGDISAARGNVTVAGLAVNQSGRISASTTVAANGSVRLLARDTPKFTAASDGGIILDPGQNGGRLEIGETSRIEVLPELTDDGTAVDDQLQLASRIEMSGREVTLRSGSQIVAPAGELTVKAASNPSTTVNYDPNAWIRVESGAQIDLSGSDVTLPMSRNLVTVELRANELRDSPAQRNGALRGQTVVVDARTGTPLADVSGALAAVPKNIAERTSRGGTAVFNSAGDVVVFEGAHIDVSGGVTTFLEGPVATSQLIGADGKLYDIGEADPSRTYVGVLNPMFRRADQRWGYIDLIAAPGINRIEPGYLAGSDAGTVQFAAPSIMMNGTLTATTTIGPYQRAQGRQPLGGQLIIGLPEGLNGSVDKDFRAPSVSFGTPQGRPPISVGDDAPLPPHQTFFLPTDYLGRGFTRTAVYSNGTITIPEETPLHLAEGSTLDLTGQRVDILADVTTTGGRIAATSVLTAGTAVVPAERAGVSVADGVALDVQGNWTNDALSALTDPFGRPSNSVLADGGSIALAIQAIDSELVIGEQVRLLANAGAWLQRDGTLQGGDGGSIAITASASHGALEIGAGTRVEAFGVWGAQGGKFSLTAPRIEVADGNVWTSGQRVDPLDEDGFGYFNIGSSLFSDHGFRSVSLAAAGAGDVDSDRDALRIADRTQLQARTSVWQMAETSNDTANARNLDGMVSVALPEDSARGAMALAFAVTAGGVMPREEIGLLRMGQGASIAADAGSSVSFTSAGGIELDGTVRAHGGSVALTVTPPPTAIDLGYRPDIGLRLGSNAVLDVSGTVVYEPVADGVLRGTLYDGGSVSLQANRGSVAVESGALIDISGSSAAFDRTLAGADAVKREVIASNAGTLSVVAPESIALSGELRAHAGTGETGLAHGGELIVRLSRGRGFSGGEFPKTFPTDPRVMRVTSEDIGVGGSPPNGFALVREDLLENSGIDALTLEADGRIEFDSLELSLGRRMVLDSPELFARDGATIKIDAPYVALGSSRFGRAASAPTEGTGSFSFNGSFIEAIGAASLSGAASTTLASTGDIRLREIQGGTAREGHLQTSGDLTLRATQIYPTTLSSYALSVLGEDGTLRIESTGAPGATPLTAGGKLTLNAANIEQNGTLLAPFGTIELNATQTLSLGAGSFTSVSGKGALIPFGRIENGEWVYQGVDRSVHTTLPERRIDLNAATIEQDANATLDLQGGGDLYAYEWIPGTGGSKDALAFGHTNLDSSQTRYGRFAIIPSQRGQFAPYDAQEMGSYDPARMENYDPSTMRDSTLEVGDSVYLSGIPGLEAGYYALLPARYALLPGAMLIEAVPNSTDIQPGVDTTLADGTPVVAGYRTFGTTGLGGTRYTGFSIRTSEQARQLATYEESLASKFYADRATRQDLPRPDLPSDAGTLSLLATTSLDMRGIVNVGAAKDGRAGRVEIASNNLEVVNTTSESADSVQISASVLNSWRPGELWLGGTRRGENVDVVAGQVRIAEGVSIAAEEVVLLANDSVELASGATVATASGTQGRAIDRDDLSELKLNLAKDDAGAAIVSVSDRRLFDIARGDGDTEVGSIDAASDSTLTTGGALLANAPGRVALDGDIRARGAAWQLGASTVRFDEAAHDNGLTIGANLLVRMQEAGSLSIASSDAIEFSYAVSLGAANTLDELSLTAGALRNLSGGDVTFGAGRVTLAGTTATAATPTEGTGTLSINAGQIELDQGNLAIDGFARSALVASSDIIGRGQSNLRVAGDLDLAAARLTAASGGHTTIDAAQGAVRISSTGTASNSITGILGGALSINADSIAHSGTLFLPSGLVNLNARSNLSMDSSGVIDVSGQLVTAANRVVGSSGGTVRLASGGDLTTAAGSRIDVSGATGASGANAGKLFAQAQGPASLGGGIRGQAGSSEATGGAFDLYAGSLANASDLIARLQTGGFTEKQALHVRTGDLTLAADQTVTARNIEWTADQGRVQVNGTMIAPSAGQRSAIRLYGRDVTIAGSARLNADAVDGARFGGDIELGSSTGWLSVARGSQFSANGAELDGSLRLRAAARGNDVQISQFGGTVRNVDDVVVEAVKIYNVPATTTAANYNAIRADLAAYMGDTATGTPNAAANIRQRLDTNGTLGLRVEAGAELRHNGPKLSLADLNLASWRFDGNPVALTVRSTGSIDINGTISDGFGASTPRTILMEGESATMRFAAGTDLTGANPNAVRPGAAGDITLGANALVRSGTGDVRLSAAHDIKFGSNSSVYTAGIPGAASEIPPPSRILITYADRGGNVALTAGHDVQGSAVTQSVNGWQRRFGLPDGSPGQARPTRWGTEVSEFKWNAGTLGGGDLSIVAGNDVNKIAAAAADSGKELAGEKLVRFGGGALSVEAGGDVNSAMLYVARGEGKISADGELGVSRYATKNDGSGDPDPEAGLGSLLMLGDARMNVTARQNIQLETIFNPTIIAHPKPANPLFNSQFFTYGDHSAVDVRSNGGDVLLDAGRQNRLAVYLGDDKLNENTVNLRILPSSLTLMSMARDVSMRDAVTLFPSDTGQLDIFAQRDFVASDGTSITMSDLAANEIPVPLHPIQGSDVAKLAQASAASARHIDDDKPALITAGRDILDHNISVAKSVQMTAGRDIVETSLRAQNLRSSDVTLVHAGRDLRYAAGKVTGEMSIGGPGRFDVLTGRNLDLGFSRGLTTTGRLQNAAIPTDEGADLNVMVGMGRDVDATAFVDEVVGGSAELRDSLVKFMVERTGNSNLTYQEAATQFMALDATSQRPLLLDLFYSELVASGRENNSDPAKGFERGYRAIDALFPGSRPKEGETNPFAGDLTLAFSRIYTLAGGDISIAVPGGNVNVGLANPPSTLNSRPESELGIVAQRAGSVRMFTNDDVLVNQSRVFTLLGGDIAIWSTLGDIDAGRGSKSSVSAPPPSVLVNKEGLVTLNFAGAVAGSGIRTISTAENVEPGDVDLIAPAGTVNAGDAGIGAGGNLNIAAQQVVGLDNIQVGGVSTGVPPETSGLGASLSAVSAVAASSSSASTSSVEETDENQEAQATLAQTALSWLEVFVVGLGEENCKQDDVECLKRQPLP